ncbi:CoA activase [Thermodesulfobacteriota bacterium]
MTESNSNKFLQTFSGKVGQFNVQDKTFLIPEMNRIGCHLLAGVFKSFGINAKVMETYRGLDLGMEYSSGKECYPCQVTLGDILYFLKKERERLGNAFDPAEYIYFMPESSGPCRFGMYNKYQRIILDYFPEFEGVKIGSLTTGDGYSLDGIVEKKLVTDLRKSAYFSVIIADVLDRLLWRIRPYEKKEGMADEFIEKAMNRMSRGCETHAYKKEFDNLLKMLDGLIEEAKLIIDPDIPPKPLIGIVGEIYLRTQIHSNQDLIKVLEKYGAEVVNASIAEWVNFITYSRLRDAKIDFRLSLKQFRLSSVWKSLKKMAGYKGELLYQEYQQKKVYSRVRELIDLGEDHMVGHMEAICNEEDLFSFDIGTEACLSIPGLLEYAGEGFNGLINIYPFTCMPSTITSAIVKPMMGKTGVPYLDTPYDSTVQPGREGTIRTFMYQAQQHMKRNGRKVH